MDDYLTSWTLVVREQIKSQTTSLLPIFHEHSVNYLLKRPKGRVPCFILSYENDHSCTPGHQSEQMFLKSQWNRPWGTRSKSQGSAQPYSVSRHILRQQPLRATAATVDPAEWCHATSSRKISTASILHTTFW